MERACVRCVERSNVVGGGRLGMWSAYGQGRERGGWRWRERERSSEGSCVFFLPSWHTACTGVYYYYGCLPTLPTLDSLELRKEGRKTFNWNCASHVELMERKMLDGYMCPPLDACTIYLYNVCLESGLGIWYLFCLPETAHRSCSCSCSCSPGLEAVLIPLGKINCRATSRLFCSLSVARPQFFARLVHL